MSRLPTPGSDNGTWGSVLNDFLLVSLNSDGTLRPSAVSNKADDSAVVHNTGSETVAGVKTFSSSPIVPTPTTATQAANKDYVDNVASSGAPDATTSTNGLVRLAGDLGGVGTTAAAPLISAGAVTGAKIANSTITDTNISGSANIAQSKVASLTTDLAGKQPLDSDLTDIAALTPTNDDVIQRKAGAWASRTPAQLKTDLALTKSDVGLGNVDNTSDANKPISTATQTALNLKADTSSVMLLAGENAGTVTSNATTNGFARIDLNYTASGSTPDSMAFYYNGIRTGYHNEKGELRSRAAADNSVPFRVQQRSNTQSANLTEWTQSDNTVLASVSASGVISAPNVDRKVSYGASQPSNPTTGDLWIQP
ncbi:MAG TPA: hypothetical protein VLA77_03865 [Candidatus Saccharimonadales bacterium]|nr:hypothetical protein [Candidatus Saccharimonadales bacterium]